MKRTPIAIATCSAALLLAACGGPDTAEETPPADGAIESEGSLTDDPAVGLEEAPGGDMETSSETSGMSDGAVTESGMDMPEGDTTMDDLQGNWISGEDDRSEMSIIDGTVTMMYDDELLSTETLELVDTCEDAPDETADMPLLTMTSTDTGEELCYGILELNDDTLELTSYPRGNTLTYSRMPVGSEPDMDSDTQ